MNKLFIVLLAVCIVTVQSALVKRDAETPNYLEDFKKQAEELSKSINDNLSAALNPDQIKKAFNDGIDNLNKIISDLSKKQEPKQ